MVGVVHANVPLTTRFTVIANQLAQHERLSLLAIGIAVHIQSLPAGSPVSIRALADRFPETEHRIGRALRELEAAGFLRRTRLRLPTGKVITRTVSYNVPLTPDPDPDPDPDSDPDPDPDPDPAPDPAPDPSRTPDPESTQDPAPPRPNPAQQPVQHPVQQPVQHPTPHPAPAATPTPTTVERPPRAASSPPAPAPSSPLARESAHLLAGLRARDPRLLLSEGDIRRLTPGVVEWLVRGVPPEGIRRTLTATLPDNLRNPAGLLAHRLRDLLPPLLPRPLHASPPPPTRDRPHYPLHNCDGCDLAFRAPTPGRCRDCRSAPPTAA
ncbi:helix-turn-helix domain-containing protein [Streptomyces sp. NPDC101118]|uniref:helix-turn-helix domain-containing protein n=1 Tax=Streptomyces sp. NPDC101118 TaxID=3366109 RepID=UPI003825BA80